MQIQAAPLWDRAFASLVDFLWKSALTFIATIPFIILGGWTGNFAWLAVAMVLLAGVFVGYPLYAVCLRSGATRGMKKANLRLVAADPLRRLTVWVVLLRLSPNLFIPWVFLAVAFWKIFLAEGQNAQRGAFLVLVGSTLWLSAAIINGLFALFRSDRRTLADILAGTSLVSVRSLNP
jgi:uncharacterized RDD family membrane protein YckC